MNTKSVLIAALIAAATSSAFAADYVATAGNPEVQIAQVTNRGAAAAAPVAKSNVATVSVSAAARKDDTLSQPTVQADGRTRAEARAQAAAYNMSAEARAARFLFAGGQQ